MTIKLFENQVAIVTGAGVGIGFEIARQLALNGAKVLLNDLDAALAEDAAGKIGAEGGGGDNSVCLGVGGDVSDVEVTRGFVSQAVAAFGRLDMVVANAGLTVWGHFLDFEPDKFDRVMNVNLRGSFFLAQAAARQMIAQNSGGRILLVSSVTGHQAIRYIAPYAMSKAALEMLARNLVLELSPYGITINCVAPGATVTPRNLADDPNYEAIWGGVTPTGRPAFPDDIANAALFLLSPASGQINGQTLIVDGGWTGVSPTPSLDFVEQGKK